MKCYYCPDEAVYMAHDSRGCVPVCAVDAGWRRFQCSRAGGHAADCPNPETKAFATTFDGLTDVTNELVSPDPSYNPAKRRK